jgi:hypothetical protein
VAITASIITAVAFSGGVAVAFSVPNNSVNSAKIVNNTVQGIDIRNNTITKADIAVNQRIFPINHRSGNVTNAVIATLNGLRFRVSCTSGVETITVRKTNSVEAEIAAMSNDAGNTDGDASQVRGNFDDNLTLDEVFPAGPDGGASSERIYTIIYSAANGSNVTAHLITEDNFTGGDCLVSGYAVG